MKQCRCDSCADKRLPKHNDFHRLYEPDIQVYRSERFGIMYCGYCLRRFQIVLTDLLGEELVRSILESPEPHLLKTFSSGNLFSISWQRSIRVNHEQYP